MRTEGGHLCKACYSKEVSHHQECLADSKAGRREGKFYDEKREGFRCALIRGCWHGEAGSELTGSGVSSVADFRIIFSFLWLVLSWKWVKKPREAGCYCPCLGHSWLTTAKVMVWLPKLAAAEVVGKCGLAMVRLYVQSLITKIT